MLKIDPAETLARKNCATIVARYAAQPPTSSTAATNGRNHFSPLLSERFKCKICGKVFPSFQALGGHVSSHAKHSLSGENASKTKGYCGEIASQKVHECKKCNFSFPTGQALGGHMRRHFDLNAKRKRFDVEIGAEGSPSQMKKIKTEILLKTEEEEEIKTVLSLARTFEKKEISLFDLNFPPTD